MKLMAWVGGLSCPTEVQHEPARPCLAARYYQGAGPQAMLSCFSQMLRYQLHPSDGDSEDAPIITICHASRRFCIRER